MAGWMKDLFERGKEALKVQLFIEGLVRLEPERALAELRSQVPAMSDREFETLISTLQGRILSLRSHAGSGSGWSYDAGVEAYFVLAQMEDEPRQRELAERQASRVAALIAAARAVRAQSATFPSGVDSLSVDAGLLLASLTVAPDALAVRRRPGAAPAAGDAPLPLDDMSRAQLFIEAQQRHGQAMLRALPDRVTGEVVEELQEIVAEYDRLLDLSPPVFPLYTENDVRRRRADALEHLGRACDSLGDPKRARGFLEQAVLAHEEVGDEARAERVREALTLLVEPRP